MIRSDSDGVMEITRRNVAPQSKSNGGSTMLVLSRKKSESVVLCKRDTMELIGVVSLVEGMSSKARIGFHFGPEVNIIRVELTTLAGIELGELEKVPLGTVIVMKPAAIAGNRELGKQLMHSRDKK